MKLLHKTVVFIISFSALFRFIRISEYYNTKILLADLGGIPWLYSTIGLIFGVIAAFAIQKEWDKWNNLVEAVKSEVASLEEMWLWAEHFPDKIKEKTQKIIVDYLQVNIKEGWKDAEKGERNEKIEGFLSLLREELFKIAQKEFSLLSTSLMVFSDLLKHHKTRLHYSSQHMPFILRNTLIFAMILLVFLSFLIGIKNVWLDYIFTLSIATLAYAVYLVIDDLDHPLRPGGWHLTAKDYEELLNRIRG